MVSRKVSVSLVISGYLAGLVMGVFVGFGLYKTFVPVEVPEQPMPLLESLVIMSAQQLRKCWKELRAA